MAPNQFATLKKSVPSAQSGTGMCIIDFVLFFAGEGDGHATVTAGGSTILTVDMLYYDTNGVPGAGSGERVVVPASPIAIAGGTVLSLSLSGCTGCDTLTVTVEAASR